MGKTSKDIETSKRKSKKSTRISSYSPPSSNENLQSLKTGLVGAHSFLLESSNNEIFNNIQFVSKVFDSISLLNGYYPSSQSSSSCASSCSSAESDSECIDIDLNNECNVEGSTSTGEE